MLPNADVIPMGPAPVRTWRRIGSVGSGADADDDADAAGADRSDDVAAPLHATAIANASVAAAVTSRRPILGPLYARGVAFGSRYVSRRSRNADSTPASSPGSVTLRPSSSRT